jgi:hypothetical protein
MTIQIMADGVTRDATPEEEAEIQQRAAADVPLLRAAQWEAIKSLRDRRKAGGVLVSGSWFHSDDASRIQQLGLVLMGAGIPADLQWKTMTGDFVTMTPALAQQIFTAVATLDQGTFACAEQHRQALLEAANPGAYDFSTGWPPIFGET